MKVRVDSSAMTRFINRSTLEIPTASQLRACRADCYAVVMTPGLYGEPWALDGRTPRCPAATTTTTAGESSVPGAQASKGRAIWAKALWGTRTGRGYWTRD